VEADPRGCLKYFSRTPSSLQIPATDGVVQTSLPAPLPEFGEGKGVGSKWHNRHFFNTLCAPTKLPQRCVGWIFRFWFGIKNIFENVQKISILIHQKSENQMNIN
jgi:hypothetical protein